MLFFFSVESSFEGSQLRTSGHNSELLGTTPNFWAPPSFQYISNTCRLKNPSSTIPGQGTPGSYRVLWSRSLATSLGCVFFSVVFGALPTNRVIRASACASDSSESSARYDASGGRSGRRNPDPRAEPEGFTSVPYLCRGTVGPPENGTSGGRDGLSQHFHLFSL